MFGSTTLSHQGGISVNDGFVAKLLDAGNSASFAWAVRLGGLGEDHAYAIATQGANVYVGGGFSGTATFGSIVLTSIGTTDLFVTKLMDAGSSASFIWTQRAGSISFNDAFSLRLVGTTVYVGAVAALPVLFGSIQLSGPGFYAATLASFTDPTLTATATPRELSGVSAFPNPAHASATVQLPAVPGATTATLTLLDALGRTLRTATVALPAAGLRHPLDLAGLPAGVYAVQVAAGGCTATHRLVVQ